MSQPVLIDISMLAHGLIPTEIVSPEDDGREFTPVFPEALVRLLPQTDLESAQLFEETLRAYKRATHTEKNHLKQRLGRDRRRSDEDVSDRIGDFMVLFRKLRQAGERSIYKLEKTDNGLMEESEWLGNQVEDEHLRYHIRAAYHSRLGIEANPQLDRYYLEVLAALTIGRSQSPRTRLLLASVGSVTLDILAAATGALTFEVESNLGSTTEQIAGTAKQYVERKRRFFAEMELHEALEELIERGGELLLSWFIDPSPGAILTSSAISAGVFLVVDGYDRPARRLSAGLRQWPWSLWLLVLLLAAVGLALLSASVCGLVCR